MSARPSSTERQNVASTPTIRPVLTKADRKAFVDLPFRLYRDDPNWVPPLKTEALGLITPEMNGWFSHAEAQLFLAERDGRVVGRISAHIDTLALTMPAEQGFGPGCGQFGLMEAEDEAVFTVLLATAEARSEEHTSELQSLMRISYAVFCLKQ